MKVSKYIMLSIISGLFVSNGMQAVATLNPEAVVKQMYNNPQSSTKIVQSFINQMQQLTPEQRAPYATRFEKAYNSYYPEYAADYDTATNQLTYQWLGKPKEIIQEQKHVEEERREQQQEERKRLQEMELLRKTRRAEAAAKPTSKIKLLTAVESGPYTFGQLDLRINADDVANKNYVYFTSAKTNAKPTDMFVTVDNFTTSPTFATTPLNSNTQYMMSLVTGKLYDKNGALSELSQSPLIALTNRLSADWSKSTKNNLNRLVNAHAKKAAL